MFGKEEIRRRTQASEENENSDSKSELDIIQWTVNTMPRQKPWPTEKIVQVIIGLWFASVHQLTMVGVGLALLSWLVSRLNMAQSVVYGLYDLCQNPQYVTPLREEFHSHGGQVSKLVLMDSFLKESARMHPSDSSQHTKSFIDLRQVF